MNRAVLNRWHCGAAAVRSSAVRRTAVRAYLVGRYCFGAVFALGAWQKLIHGWLWTDTLQHHFVRHLESFDLTPFQAGYLEHFAIPWYLPIAWLVTFGELAVALGLIFGVATKASGALALFLLVNFAAGGFFNTLSLPFVLFAALLVVFPSRKPLTWRA